MTELQQARADYIAALEREQKLMRENADLQKQVFDLRMKLMSAEYQATISETCLKALVRS
jgi:hypothetical protein